MATPAAFWDGIAETYASKPVENPEAFERKIAITRALMTPESVVLDVGCGTGSLALRLAASGAHIHGLDISSEMNRIAKEKARAAGVQNVTFHCGPFDAAFDRFDAESLDGVCAYSILHLLEDHHAALAQMYRLLKPGGFFVSSTVCLGQKRYLYGPVLWVMRMFGKAPMVKLLTANALADDIGAAGFVDVAQPDVGAQSEVAFITARKPS
ncbi:MAG: class I SAM-dependent methyltransferase [Myxococcales bacterium]|nr:class I SAM-dependent methyltransferase [Myxococcales bacterium]MDD9967275.1 class I SAM-dependent methyltransferase [Myxococcales bacterium]